MLRETSITILAKPLQSGVEHGELQVVIETADAEDQRRVEANFFAYDIERKEVVREESGQRIGETQQGQRTGKGMAGFAVTLSLTTRLKQPEQAGRDRVIAAGDAQLTETTPHTTALH